MLDTRSVVKYVPYVAILPSRGRRIDYCEVAPILSSFRMPVFLPISRKTAYYARRRLSELVGEEVVAVPAKWRELRGYLFLLRGWLAQGDER